jgi:hypothetical protein
MNDQVGFAPDEIRPGEPTRAARLKWVIAVDAALPAGRAVNAAVCTAAATGAAVTGLLGPDAKDADGSPHPGLPWAGCTILAATREQLARLRARAAQSTGIYLADMPAAAQHTRIYAEYFDTVAATGSADLGYYAVSMIGPRNRVDNLVKGLTLLS